MLIKKQSYYLIDNISHITPEDFEAIASQMRIEGVEYIEISSYGYDNYLEEYCFREETEQEKTKREKEEKELKLKFEKNKSKKRLDLIKRAKELGMSISLKQPIQSNYDHVYWVQKGMNLSGEFIVPKDGYIWYDESGSLGDKKIYTTAKKANEALSKYVKEVLK